MKTLPKQFLAILFAALTAVLIAQQPDQNVKQKEMKGEKAWEVIAQQKQTIIAQQQAQAAEQSFRRSQARLEELRKELCQAEKAPLDACQLAANEASITVMWREAPKPETKPESKPTPKAESKK